VRLETQRTKTRIKAEPCDPRSLERGVRQLLADKVSDNLVGLWLLVPEHLRLGTWDLLRSWAQAPAEQVEPRLALQLVHEAALCHTGIRRHRALSQRGFELLNGLPFLASDRAIHELLAQHTVAEAQGLQRALGAVRRASHHFAGRLLAVDPHRLRSYSQRQMRRHLQDSHSKPVKMAQTFFVIDADTHQPVCFVTGTASRTVTQATPELLKLAAEILQPQPHQTLVLADAEHFTAELVDEIHEQTDFDLLVPLPDQPALQPIWPGPSSRAWKAMSASAATPSWSPTTTP
jgi:hypothetical protein